MAPAEVTRRGRTSSPAPLKEASKNSAVAEVKENVIAVATETKPKDWVPLVGQRVRRMDGNAWASKTGWSVAEGEILLIAGIDKDGDLSLQNAEGLVGPFVLKKFYQLVDTQDIEVKAAAPAVTQSRRFSKCNALLFIGVLLLAALGFYILQSGLNDYPHIPAFVDFARSLPSKFAFEITSISDVRKHAWPIPFAAAMS